MEGRHIDYSLYLVTDNSFAEDDPSFFSKIEGALQGGVTLVQLREKSLDTGPFIERAIKLKALTSQYNVPLLINDRVDVAMAADADGVHIGQDDMPLCKARRLLGPTKIIGVSANDEREAAEAIQDGADYLGIGAVWFTSTKQVKQHPLGIQGVQRVLTSIESTPIPTVAIGGINLENAEELLRDSRTAAAGLGLDGLAIVSAIMNADDPKATCCTLKTILRRNIITNTFVDEPVRFAVQAARRLRQTSPMVHHITNYVVINDNANATLAVGASPIMSANREELMDLARVNGAMILNIGTLNDLDTMIAAAQANIERGTPVVLDPVGAGATTFRMESMNRFLDAFQPTILKGNGGEILALAGHAGHCRGVDSVGDLGGETSSALATKALAQKHKCVVAMTGPIDYVSDGQRVYAIDNGDTMLSQMTGSGCMVSSVVACFAAANRQDYLFATISGILIVTVASELAMKRGDVRGPGTFRTALIDELYLLSQFPETMKQYAKVRTIQM